MQASNKTDAAQVYEGATRATKTGIKDTFKYLLKPLTIFSYHYFVEGIRAVQKDGPTKELEKITNLSYEEVIRVMEKCQKDGVRVVASERKLATEDSEFGKKKSLYQQKRLTKYARRIKQMSNIKADYPRIAKLIHLTALIQKTQEKHKQQIEEHTNKRYNIYFNKSKAAYMGQRLEDIVNYRTGVSKELFSDNENIQSALENVRKHGVSLNSEQLKELSQGFKLHEIGNVEIEDFKKDYCIHDMDFASFLNMKDDLEVADIPYGVHVVTKDDNEQTVKIYFENKHLERYTELGFSNIGQIYVYGTDNKNLQWNINSQDELISFTTKVGEEEKHAYETLSGKNYIMKRQENDCVWTVFKSDLKELAEKEKKRDVVNEDLERITIFEQLEKDNANSPIITENVKEIEVNFDDEKEVGE